MTLLNMESDGMPNVLLALFRYVLSERSVSRDKLIEVCAPISVCDPKRARATLNTWTKLGLFVSEKENEVRIAPDFVEGGEATLRKALRTLIFRETSNDPFWESEGALASDFTRALSWCLAMDPDELPGGGYSGGVNQLENETVPAERSIFRNDTRWNGFKAWARFLGFAWQAPYPKKYHLVVDPTDAIAESLSAIFAGERRLDQRTFFERLAREIPVLDGGAYRAEIEARMLKERWSPPVEGRISRSLSIGLVRLKSERRLTWEESKHDDPGSRAVLTARGGGPWQSFSQLSLEEAVPWS
jgi:hypothetical protein